MKIESTPVVAKTVKLRGMWTLGKTREKSDSDSLKPEKYVSNGGVEFKPHPAVGSLSLRVLQFLEGRLLDEVVMAYVQSLRPSSVRVCHAGGMVNADARIWRVTIFTFKVGRKHYVNSIYQEVNVGLPNGVSHGEALSNALDHGINSNQVKWWDDEIGTIHCDGRVYKQTDKGCVQWRFRSDRNRSIWKKVTR